MKQAAAFAPGKIILSGEYAVVFGYPGVAIPSSMGIEVHWIESPDPLNIVWAALHEHPKWEPYLQSIIGHCEKITGKTITGTMTITSSLPLQRGMGSSTALVIALVRCLLGPDCRSQALKIEDAVNPGHSGLDFAVIWEGKPMLFTRDTTPVEAKLDLDFLQFAELIDTGKPAETTAELVAWVKDRRADIDDALAIIGECTESLIAGEHPLTVFPDHHRAQLALGVIPDHVHELIMNIEHAGGAAKVIGAGGKSGGGGMVLAIPPRKKYMPNWWSVGESNPGP